MTISLTQRQRYAALGAFGAAIVAMVLIAARRFDWWWIDGQIYARAGRLAIEAPEGLYLDAVGEGAFTYPPFAALVFMPLGLASQTVAAMVFQVASMAALLAVVIITLRTVGWSKDAALLIGGAAGLVALLFYPTFRSTFLGQVDIQLMLLVVIDLLRPRSRWLPRGVLVGIAAAIKLTPAIFVVVFLIRRDYKSAVISGATGVVATLVGFIARPGDSLEFWTEAVWSTQRVGAQFAAANQNLAAVISRAVQPDQHQISGSARYGWLVAVVVVVGLGLAAARRSHVRGEAESVVFSVAVMGLLISPMSWMHHWVWTVPILVALLARSAVARSKLGIAMSFLGMVAFSVNPRWFFGVFSRIEGELTWNGVEQILGASAVWWSLGYLLLMVFGVQGRAGRPAEEPATRGPGVHANS